MKDAKTGNLAEKAVVLDQILCGDKQDMTAGEYMETLRTQECTAKEVTDIALVLVSHKNEFLNKTHFNDDYRFRILSWLARQAEGSMAAKAAHTTLVNLVIASDERLGREPSCQLAFSLAETAMETAASGDTLRAFLTCIAAPDIWDILGSSMHPDAPESQRKLRGLVEDFLTDREAVLANIPYIRMAFEFFFHAKQQGDGRMCRAFLDLYMKNVTPSSTSYKTLSQSYHRPCEIIALNLVCLHSTAPGPSPVMDNIMKNFLACIAGRNEGEPFTELEAETFRSVLGRSFSRKANGYERTKEYFCFLTEQFHNDYHTAARDEDSWERLYRTLGGTISFTEAGFLAFDPLDEGNRQRWDILSAQHKKQLLDYRCKDLFRVGLDSPYQEEWRGLAKIVQKRLTEIPVPANAQAQEPCSPAYTHRMQYAANTMIQAGLMDVPTGREYFWLLCVHPDMELQYLLQYYGEHGAVPGWTKKLIQNEKTTNETFDWVGGPVFTDMEKQKLCRILLDAAWDSNPCDYRYTALDFFLTHRELVGITFTQAEAASIAGILISCMALSDQDRQALMRYTMPEEEWEHQKQLEDRARMEQQKLEELQEFQEEIRERLQTLIEDLTGKSSGFWFSRIKFANPAVKPELARIATLCIKEKDIPAASKIRHYAEIAEAAECDGMRHVPVHRTEKHDRGEKMMNTNMKRNSSQGIHVGNGTFARQMAGRILLSSVVGPMIGLGGYYYLNDIPGRALAGIAPEAEYPLAMAILGLKNQETAIQRILLEMGDHTKKDKDAAAHILCHMDQHRKNINEIFLLPGGADIADGRMRTYIYAFAGAMEAGAEELFLSLDGKRLARTLPDDTTVAFRIFQILPFFENAEYIFHALVNKRMREGFDQIDPGLLSLEEKRMLGSREFLSSRITIRKETVCACARNPEAFRFLKYLSVALRPWIISAGKLTRNAGKLTNAEPCIRILTYLDKHHSRQTRLFLLISGQGYDKRLICAADKKLREDTGRYLDETAEMSACMEAAWLLDRDDVLAFQEAKWWDSRYEDIILHAMTHKWDRFLSGLNGSEALRDAAWYLRGVCGQINANLFSNKQLEAVSKQDLLPEAGTVPEWMGNVTYDQLLALKEIRQISPAGYRETFMAVFQKLSGILKPEAAAKRMAQFAEAWNTPVMDYLAEEIEIEETAACLAECDMYAWCRKVFPFKPSHTLAARALPYIRRIPAFSEAETEQDAWFILRNKELCKDGLSKAKEVFCQTDPEVLALKEWLGIEDAFYEKYKKESTEFLMQDTAVANAYVCAMSIYANQQKDAFRLIVKAAMCGKLTELKYHTGDLGKETGILMDERTVKEWIRDMDMPFRNEFSGTCVEDSTFHGIMTMGARPFDTCMHYANGSHRECLMSYFDANKKILYRIDGSGKTVARAVLRLTKASTKAVKGTKGGFSFVDVEDEAAEEYPILFLERMYSGYQGESRKKLAADLVRAAREKADHMGFAPVLADDYADLLDLKREGFHLETISVYITRSKSSAQYLDSFGGMKTYDKGEDTYMQARCLVQDVR